ncbi:cation diffusion facilitator family transporter [Pyrolobus fumarii 1A]|uniref:Cation diffusion facilitator family transporter n=1 Tax=Pyrolobus fumarii (strain DSM 11204 / 1A) TaxID=694429 RepID=G0EDT7_PYRF1|nr:cation transporter [Pyrolobus fumarii]AEM38706.1 cation diffusion facilitator family transporter [Pyrolobus fumarii 1A]
MLIVFVLVLIGTVLKGLAALEGSKAAFVDLLTCIANLVAMGAVYQATRIASMPADRDHPYGHKRFEAAGVLWVTVIYGFISGYAAAELLLEPPAHTIPLAAAYYATAGIVAYAAAILLARRMGLAGKAYAAFTFSEIYEGVATVIAALGGSLINPLIDLIIAWGLLAYLLYELYEHVMEVTELITERVPPELIEAIERELEKRGLHVVSVRLRPVLPGEYIGDAIVRVDSDSLREAHRVVDEVEEVLRQRRVILTIHYEPVEK